MKFHSLKKIAANCNRDLTPYEIGKGNKDTLVFEGDNCVNKALDFLSKLKREERKVKKNIDYLLQLHAYNCSGFDTWLFLKNIPCDRHIVGFIKNGKGIISMKAFNGHIQINDTQYPQYLISRCGMTHLKHSLKNLRKRFELRKEIFRVEMNHDEIYADNWRDKTYDLLYYVKNDVLCTAFSYAGYSKAVGQKTSFGMKDWLSLGWKYLKSLRDEKDEHICTNNDKYISWFTRPSKEGGGVCSFNQYIVLKILWRCFENLIRRSECERKYLWIYRNVYKL